MDVEDDNKKWPGKFVMMLEALAHRIRRNIFSLLLKHPSLSFNQLMTKLKIERASLAYHLGILRKANLINNFYDKREGVKDHSFYELSAFGNKIYQELFEKVEHESKLEKYNTINFRNAISYTIEHELQLKAAKARQKEGEAPSEVVIVNGDNTLKVTEWQTQVLNPDENKKLYSCSEELTLNATKMSNEELSGVLKNAVKEFYLRPNYILRRMKRLRFSEIRNNAKGLWAIIKN